MKTKGLSLNISLFVNGCILFLLAFLYSYICELINTPKDNQIYYFCIIVGIFFLILAMYYYIIQLRDPLYKFFRVTGLGVNGAYPFLQRKEIQDNNTIYRYSLPVGMSTDDIQKKQLAMEQSLGKRIMIQYHRKSTFLITTINQN